MGASSPAIAKATPRALFRLAIRTSLARDLRLRLPEDRRIDAAKRRAAGNGKNVATLRVEAAAQQGNRYLGRRQGGTSRIHRGHLIGCDARIGRFRTDSDAASPRARVRAASSKFHAGAGNGNGLAGRAPARHRSRKIQGRRRVLRVRLQAVAIRVEVLWDAAIGSGVSARRPSGARPT